MIIVSGSFPVVNGSVDCVKVSSEWSLIKR